MYKKPGGGAVAVSSHSEHESSLRTKMSVDIVKQTQHQYCKSHLIKSNLETSVCGTLRHSFGTLVSRISSPDLSVSSGSTAMTVFVLAHHQ